MIDLCIVGDLHWLIIFSIPPEQRGKGNDVSRLLGNDAAIVSLLASRLGLRSGLVATNAIARADGQPLIDFLTKEGVDVSLIDTGGAATPRTFLILQRDLDQRIFLADDYAFCDLAPRNFPPSRFAYIDFYEGNTEQRLAIIQQWSQNNVRYLVNLSASSIQEKVRLLSRIPSIDMLQIGGQWSIEESRRQGKSIRDICHTRLVIVTLGSLGALLVEQNDDYYIPAESIQPLRSVGAGASFSAGFLSALAQGASYRDAAIFASKYAALFCTVENNPLNVTR